MCVLCTVWPCGWCSPHSSIFREKFPCLVCSSGASQRDYSNCPQQLQQQQQQHPHATHTHTPWSIMLLMRFVRCWRSNLLHRIFDSVRHSVQLDLLTLLGSGSTGAHHQITICFKRKSPPPPPPLSQRYSINQPVVCVCTWCLFLLRWQRGKRL